MDPAQRLLFDGFPRSVGVTTPQTSNELRQFVVHSEAEMDIMLESADGRRTPYCSIARFVPVLDESNGWQGNRVVIDKVGYDLDSPAKAEESGVDWDLPGLDPCESETSVMQRMRVEEGLAKAILGPVCEDARALAKRSLEDGLPVVGVFSGFGLHVYQLFEETDEAGKAKIATTAKKYIAECELDHADPKVVGEIFRIMRVPNTHRTEGGEKVGAIHVPLSGRELTEIQPQELLELSTSPRPEALSTPGERPEMTLHDEYEDEVAVDGIDQTRTRGVAVDFEEAAEDDFRELLEMLMPMPCVHERAVQPNPDHAARYNIAAMLFNAGLRPPEVHQLIRRLDWIDYDPEVTSYMLESVWMGSSAEKGCARMMAEGLCRRSDAPQECECYGWKGGDKYWP